MPLAPGIVLLLSSGPRLWLLVFAGVLLLCMLPAWYGACHDNRIIHGVGVWVKPLKFMAALALFAATTAVLMLPVGATPAAQHALNGIATLLIATAGFECAYITLQASRGQPSHYNASDPLHIALTVLMALGAVGLVGSQV